MQIVNTVFINTDIQHDCGHVIPATLEILGEGVTLESKEAWRVTLDIFFVTRRLVRFFDGGLREHRITQCPKCHQALPKGF